MREPLTVGSLFAGVGGFDLAAERAGMRVVWQSENDKAASQVLAHHWPNIPNYGDIHDIRTPPTVDVLVGGFPCQDYSVAGTRGGLAGDRGALWWEFHRLITEGRPRWVIGENVPGILSSRSGRDFATIIDSLTELGYRVGWRVLDAQYFGVAQRRRRVFIVGHLGNRSVAEVLALGEGLSGHPRPSRPARPPAASGTRAGAEDSGLLADTGVPRALTERYGKAGSDLTDAEGGHLVASQSFLAYNVYPASGQGADLEAKPTDRAMTLSALNGQGHDRGTRIVEGVDLYNQTVTGDQHVPLRTAGGHGAPAILDTTVRRLTPLECERLQGFPDHWTDTQSDTQRYRQMGNAVAVPVAEWIMRRITACYTDRSRNERRGS